MHALGLREGALELYAIGMTPGWIARELGAPRRTVGHWLNRPRPARRLESARPLPPEPYSYLLGLYLGDGHIATGAHGQSVLTIACDAAYPGIIGSARAASTSAASC